MGDEPTFTSARAELPTGSLGIAARTLVEERLRGLRKAVGRELAPVDIVIKPARANVRRHLFEEACELYWNELNWEQISDEELVGDGELTEMVFPGLLSLVSALLPKAPNGEPDRDREHRDVAHDFLLWLAARLVELRNARSDGDRDVVHIRRQTAVTDELIDLVSFQLYSLSDDEIAAYQAR
jgi:hypothetical protein